VRDLALPKTSLLAVPELLQQAGEKPTRRFIEFFTATIRNTNTRQAYAQACRQFFDAMSTLGLSLHQIEPVHVAMYIEQLGKEKSAPTIKQHLAAIRQLFDYLVVGQIVPLNPASSVKSPKHVVTEGKTPILTDEEIRTLFAQFDESNLIDVRDRAMLSVMLYSFARVGAVVKLRVRDFYRQSTKAWFVLSEKGGKQNRVPAHHQAAEWVADYIDKAGIGEQRDTPLFRSVLGRTGQLTERSIARSNVFTMIRKRTNKVGLPEEIGCHSFRGSGITNYLRNGGTIERAASIAGHASTKTTQLYDRRSDLVDQSEIEKIRF
jgi:site-specific recombinase XerD